LPLFILIPYLRSINPKNVKTRILSLALFIFLPVITHSQSAQPTRTYYAVVGVFAKLDNAIRYTDKANKNNFSAQYEINPSRKLYYVYLLSSTDRKKAFAFMIKMRAETEYKDCWLFIGKLGENAFVAEEKPIEEKPIEEKPVVETPVETVPVQKDSIIIVPVVPFDSSTIVKPVVEKPVVKKPEGKPFLFKFVNAATGNEVMGEVHIQESNKATQYQAFVANQVAYLKAPINKNGTYTLITQAPGYRQMRTIIPYSDPGVSQGAEGEYIIALDLTKAKSGDYIDFNNVRFVRNSSIMNPESQNELDGLVALMQENLKYKIKIHGHCNGKQDREIITLGTSQKFFQMDPGANVKLTTSAKALSEERANAVKAYLVGQGIDSGRIKVKGEGGKIPLYPEGSTLANYNDRVEIEVKKN
jgi:outer membrane protein OmpA-like peptidoglycan-associated protein